MTRSILATAAALGATVASAAAQDARPYAEFGAGYVFEENFNTIGLTGRAGVRLPAPDPLDFLDGVAFEGELFFGLDGEDNGPVEASINYSISGSALAIFEAAPNLDLFTRLGLDISQAEVEGSGFFAGGEREDTEVGVLIGAGAKLKLSPRTGIRFDFSHRNDYEIIQAAYSVSF